MRYATATPLLHCPRLHEAPERAREVLAELTEQSAGTQSDRGGTQIEPRTVDEGGSRCELNLSSAGRGQRGPEKDGP